jgi:hypothetical protein
MRNEARKEGKKCGFVGKIDEIAKGDEKRRPLARGRGFPKMLMTFCDPGWGSGAAFSQLSCVSPDKYQNHKLMKKPISNGQDEIDRIENGLPQTDAKAAFHFASKDLSR